MTGTLYQNGIVERMNITILEHVICIILKLGLPKSFRGKTSSTLTYLINIYPSTRIKFNTSMKVQSETRQTDKL